MATDFFRTIRKVLFHLFGMLALMFAAGAILFFIFAKRPIDYDLGLSYLAGIPVILMMGLMMGVTSGWGIATRFHVSPNWQLTALLLGGLVGGLLFMAMLATLVMGAEYHETGTLKPASIPLVAVFLLYSFCTIGALLIAGWSFLWAPMYRSYYDFE